MLEASSTRGWPRPKRPSRAHRRGDGERPRHRRRRRRGDRRAADRPRAGAEAVEAALDRSAEAIGGPTMLEARILGRRRLLHLRRASCGRSACGKALTAASTAAASASAPSSPRRSGCARRRKAARANISAGAARPKARPRTSSPPPRDEAERIAGEAKTKMADFVSRRTAAAEAKIAQAESAGDGRGPRRRRRRGDRRPRRRAARASSPAPPPKTSSPRASPT